MLNESARIVHEMAVSKGFWDGDNNPSEKLLLIVSEAVEAMEEIRNGHHVNEMYYDDSNPQNPKPEGVPAELADIIIRTLDVCAGWGIDIDKAVWEKVRYNSAREMMHGRRF